MGVLAGASGFGALNMRNLILAAMALLASLAAYPAAAGNVRFTLTSNDFAGAMTWVLPESPIPDFSDLTTFDLDGPFFGEVHDPDGDGFALFGGFTFFTQDDDGGFQTDGIAISDGLGFIPFSLDLFGDQLFTGTTDTPTFRLGTFLLHDGGGDCGCGDTFAAQAVGDFTLTIGAAVPEPTSWAIMIAGFGLAGAALRRRRAVAA
ncbi:MAG: hypothetical protein JWQ29_2692 [Phenylobacterium sp.]|nr:hypothetical protein [Phenylobacterium sp.]